LVATDLPFVASSLPFVGLPGTLLHPLYLNHAHRCIAQHSNAGMDVLLKFYEGAQK